MINIKNKSDSPQIVEMPPMTHSREEFSLILGPDGKLYAIGGNNSA